MPSFLRITGIEGETTASQALGRTDGSSQQTGGSDHKDWIVCLATEEMSENENTSDTDAFVFGADTFSDEASLGGSHGTSGETDPSWLDVQAENTNGALILPAIQTGEGFSPDSLENDFVVADAVIVDHFSCDRSRQQTSARHEFRKPSCKNLQDY